MYVVLSPTSALLYLGGIAMITQFRVDNHGLVSDVETCTDPYSPPSRDRLAAPVINFFGVDDPHELDELTEDDLIELMPVIRPR